jgi:RNA polymerase sigma-70 factor (ECF subfamily)
MTASPGIRKVEDRDTALIQAINAGERRRFNELVARYQGPLYNFGLRMCGNPHDVEDLIQETFLNIFKYLPGFRFETQFKNWVYRIATSACLKAKRRSKYAPERELSLEEFLPQGEERFPSTIPDWALKPLDQVLNRELAGTLKTAILELPQKYRLVLLLRDTEGFSTAETAEIMNITPANVKVRLHRARLYLRDKLKDYFQDELPRP